MANSEEVRQAIEKLQDLTNKLLNEALSVIHSGQANPSMEKYLRIAEYLLQKSKEYVDGAWEMIKSNKCDASIALSRWVLEASLNQLWAVADENENVIEQRVIGLVGDALRNEVHFMEDLAKLYPRHAATYVDNANNAQKIRTTLDPPNIKSLRERVKQINPISPDRMYSLYRICCTKSHPGLRLWESFDIKDNTIISKTPIDNKQIACWMVTASTFYLVSSCYCLTKLESGYNLKDLWCKKIEPLLENT